MDEFRKLVAARESCRDYADRQVEPELLNQLIETARLAPSACNSQPWYFTVVTGGEKARETAKCLQDLGMNKFTEKAPAFIVITEEKATLSAKIVGKLKDRQFAQIDIGIAAAHIVLQAADLGLSTCILGWLNEDKLCETLGLAKGSRVRLVISVGYARTPELRVKKRKPLGDIARFI